MLTSSSNSEISSDRQGALTPTTAAVINKNLSIEEVTAAGGGTPRQLDQSNLPRNQWATLSVEETTTIQPTTNNRIVIPSRAVPVSSTPPPTVTPPTTTTTTTARNHASSTQVGILPDRYTEDLVHWQSPSDLPERRLMVQRIIAMTKHKRLDASVAGMDRTPSLAKRIELSLYSRAASFNEYKDLNTLRRRLQSLVSLSFHEAALSRRVSATPATASTTVGNKRKLIDPNPSVMTPFGVTRLLIKKSRTTQGVIEVNEKDHQEEMIVSSGCQSFLQMSDDLLSNVFSFLTGKEIIQNCIPLNRFTRLVLPRHVKNLQVELNEINKVFTSCQAKPFLMQFTSLEELCVYNKNKPCDFMVETTQANSQQENGLSLHAWGCSELDISHDNIGEEIVKQIAQEMENGACRRLKSLRLVSIFTNTCRGNGLHQLCAALVKGSCPQLEDLLLGGNGFSDVGTVDIAWLLKYGSLPNLHRLDLRRNYIGESGLKRIMSALSNGRCQNLKFLCMGGNIITDNCVKPVVDLLSSSLCPQMRFLGLEDNFLSARGVHAIIQAAVVGGMMPKLHHVSNDGETSTTTAAMATTGA